VAKPARLLVSWPAMSRALTLLLVGALGGCIFGHDVRTGFPMGLEPLETNSAELPTVPDTLSVVTGENDKWAWGHGRAIISAAPAAVWQALKNPDVVASRRQTDRYSVKVASEPLYEWSFELHYEVDNIITVARDKDWRFGTIRGKPDAPELAIIRYQKVYGSSFIDLIEGSVIVMRHGADEAEVQLIQHVSALSSGQDNIRTTFVDTVAALVAVSHGQPIPPL
jgi:hypothetical protein